MTIATAKVCVAVIAPLDLSLPHSQNAVALVLVYWQDLYSEPASHRQASAVVTSECTVNLWICVLWFELCVGSFNGGGICQLSFPIAQKVGILTSN